MPKHNNYVYFAVGLFFALIFVGTNIKVAKADYVTMLGDKPIEVKYNADSGKLDVYYVGETEPLATGVSFTQDESTNNRGVLDMGDLEEKSKGTISKDTEIKAPEREEQAGVTDSSEEADDYSCSQVGVCGTTVIGYNSDPNDPNYALYSDTDAQEIITVYLRNSGQAEGNDAWDQAGGEAYASLINSNQGTLSSDEVNDILGQLGVDFRVDPNISEVSRKDVLDALAKSVDNENEEEEEDEDEVPSEPVLPPAGPFVPITECTFMATPTEILYSKSSQLNWSCNQTNGCSIKDEFNMVVQSSLPTVSGGAKVTPLKTTRYYLNCPENKTWETMVRVFSSGIQ
jgi:hypothetical protein